MKDPLGDRMKSQYEDRTRFLLPRRTYTMLRVDGKAFHTYTRGCNRPFDAALMQAMDETATALCASTMGAKFAYVQSDEISVLLTDFEDITTQSLFDGNLQKIVSTTAAAATAAFIKARLRQADKTTLNFDKFVFPTFDCRAFTIPDRQEVINCFIWRQNDATRNSISMAAQSMFSHKELQGKNSSQLQDMLHQKGINWNNYPVGAKRGRVIRKETIKTPNVDPTQPETVRSKWTVSEPPIFTQDRPYIEALVPSYPL